MGRGGGDHLLDQQWQRWVKIHPSRSRSTEAVLAPKAMFLATRPAGEPPGPGRGSMRWDDALGGIGGVIYCRYGVDSRLVAAAGDFAAAMVWLCAHGCSSYTPKVKIPAS